MKSVYDKVKDLMERVVKVDDDYVYNDEIQQMVQNNVIIDPSEEQVDQFEKNNN